MSGNLFICAKSDGQNLRRPTLTEAFPDPAKSTFPDACLLRFRISRLARADHGGVWLCTDWVRTDATTEVVLRLAASDPPSSTLCRDGHCKWVSPNDDGGNSESKDELFHQIPPISISMSIRVAVRIGASIALRRLAPLALYLYLDEGDDISGWRWPRRYLWYRWYSPHRLLLLAKPNK